MNKKKPTESELEILQIIWEKGSCSVREVNDALRIDREVGYTTSLKIMQIMHHKELLTRKKHGKMHVYTAAISKEETQNQVVKKLLDGFFQGSAAKLALHALGSANSSEQDLKEIRTFLRDLEKSDGSN